MSAPTFFLVVVAIAAFLAFVVADDPGYVLRPVADLCFGGAPRSAHELDRLFSFRRGFAWGVGLSAAVAIVAVALVLL